MLKRLLILLLALPLIGNAQSELSLGDLMASSSSRDKQLAETRINHLVELLQSKKSGPEVAFLRKIFRQTQKTFLGQYDPYSEFGELFTSGKYDCLTATSLFSLVLDQLQIKYNVVETNYHIFIVVNTSKGSVLFETTDRFNGFVTRETEIKKRIGSYRQNLVASDDDRVYRYNFDLFHHVAPAQLPGLLYYNQAVKEFNNGKLEKSATLLVKARTIYDTPRIAEFSAILLRAVAASQLDDQTKQRIIGQFKNSGTAVLASR